MPMVNVTTACVITHRSPMTIRAAIRSGELPAVEGRWHGGRKGEPGRVWWIDVEDLRVWHEAHGGKGRWNAGAIPAASVESLEAENTKLRAELDALRAGRALIAPLAPVAPVEPMDVAMVARTPRPTIRRPGRARDAGKQLPDGYVGMKAYTMLHGARESQMSTFRGSRYLGWTRGDWRVATDGPPYTIVVHDALKPEAQARFHELWARAPWFLPRPETCEHCASLGHAPTAVSIGPAHSAPSSVPQSE